MANPVKLMATVEELEAHGRGVYRVVMRPSKAPPRFKAGQFLHLSVDPYDPAGGFWPESRVFSIASKSGEATITIVYSVNGAYTKKMEAYLGPGKTAWIKLPYGDFLIDAFAAEGRDLVLVAGGTGISPYLAFIEGLAASTKAGQKVRLYYGVRSPDQLLAADLLRESGESGRLDLRVHVESRAPGEAIGLPSAPSLGMLDIDAIFGQCSDLAEPVFCLSGPPGMIENFKRRLIERSVPSERIRIDEWE
jgi:ferredoxin-NADP reductase